MTRPIFSLPELYWRKITSVKLSLAHAARHLLGLCPVRFRVNLGRG